MARRWSAVLARLGVPTGDGRILAEGGITSRDLPLPLMWQRKTEDGHGGAVVVGRIEEISFGNGMVTAHGSFLDVRGAAEAEALTDAGVTGPSVDIFDDIDVQEAVTLVEAGVVGPNVVDNMDDIEYVMDDQGRTVVISGRIAAATLVPIPAFADVSITADPEPVPMMDMAYAAELTSFAMATQERMARTEVRPPAEWFQRPDVDRLTPLTVTDTGRVFGHIAPWDQCHVGLPGCVTPPSSPTGYSYFHMGAQRTAEGVNVPVGTLSVGGGHADAQLGFRAAAEHYDNVGAAVAKVIAGEDEFGIWVAGWMLPDADPVRVEQFISSPVSGDWRSIGGSLEMIAVCAVNSPGFPVPRARVSFASGAQRTLVGTFGIKAERGDIDAYVRVAEAPDGAPVDVAALSRARADWARAEWNRSGR